MLNEFILLQPPLSTEPGLQNVCRQMFPSLLGMSSGGHFSGNMRTFFIRRNSSRKPIVLSWQGAPRKHVSSYIKFAILTFALVSSGGKGSAREAEWERVKRREVTERRFPRTTPNFLMESPEAGRQWGGGQREQQLPLGWEDRAVVKGGSKVSNQITCSFADPSAVHVKH